MNGSIRIRVQATESSQPGTEPLILFEIGDESYLLSLLAATLMVNALQSQMQTQNPQIDVPNTSFWLPPDGAERLVRALRSQMQEAQRPFPPVHLEPDSADHLVKALKSQIQEAQRPFLYGNRN